MARARIAPRVRRLGLAAVLALLALGAAACGSSRFADSPYRRITEADPRKGGYRVRVVAAEENRFDHVSSVARPAPAELRAAVCEGLGRTRFACVDEGDPAEVADYVVRVSYDVVEERRPLARTGLAGAIMGGRSFIGEDDPAGEAAHHLSWKFGVYRRGEAVPIFLSATIEEKVQVWRMEVSAWIRRYFSPTEDRFPFPR